MPVYPHPIRNTRRLLVTAAAIMSVFLLTSSIVTITLIPPDAFEPGGKANGRALAYLAHLELGEWFLRHETEEREVYRIDRSEVCCDRDGGRSSGTALQEEVPNHPTLRRLRAGVVSSGEKAHYQCVRCEPRRRTQVNH